MRTHRIFPGTTSFLILLALAEGPSSGSDIQSQIIADTVGRYITKSTLYDDLKRLTADGLVEPVLIHGAEKIVALTARGRKRFVLEAQLLQMMAQTARERMARV
jgi:DNA-binding PadR family transcriptional regulator